ncbi:MAG: DHH family phosphoesterase [Patescibacteria group bacterium]|nr:DHH family phosphoesterase [Patescibacteria group bacterium]
MKWSSNTNIKTLYYQKQFFMTTTNNTDVPNQRKLAKQAILEAQNILVCIDADKDGDSIGASLSLYEALSSHGKQVSLISTKSPDNNYIFLPSFEKIQTNIDIQSNDFIISIPSQHIEIDKMKYTPEDTAVNIVISLKSGKLSPEDIQFKQSTSNFDLIIIPATNNAGALQERYKDLFADTTVLNIDHHANNSMYGDINFIDTQASSTCEMLVGMLESLDPKLINEKTSTALLTGIIAETESFKNKNTTPKSFSVAANLLGRGAQQKEIVSHLYKTKKLNRLKLWGRILSNIEEDTDNRYIWSTIKAQDFAATQTTIHDSNQIIEDLISHAPNAEIIVLFYEEDGSIGGIIHAISPEIPANRLAKLLGGDGNEKEAHFSTNKGDIQQVLSFVQKKIGEYQEWRKKQTEGATSNNKKQITRKSVPEPVIKETVPEPVIRETIPEPVIQKSVPEPVIQQKEEPRRKVVVKRKTAPKEVIMDDFLQEKINPQPKKQETKITEPTKAKEENFFDDEEIIFE